MRDDTLVLCFTAATKALLLIEIMSLKIWLVVALAVAVAASPTKSSDSGEENKSGIGDAIEIGEGIGENIDKMNLGCVKDDEYGCHKGYCWSYCSGAGTLLFGITKEWCYTTMGRSQDHKYVKCTSDDDCDACWKCAGPCTL